MYIQQWQISTQTKLQYFSKGTSDTCFLKAPGLVKHQQVNENKKKPLTEFLPNLISFTILIKTTKIQLNQDK